MSADKEWMRSRTTPTTRLVIVALAALMFLCLPAFLAMAGASTQRFESVQYGLRGAFP